MSDEKIDGVEDIDVEYEVTEEVDLTDVPDDEPEEPEELDVDYLELPNGEDAGE